LRYPGRHQHQARQRWLILIAALLFFGLSLTLASGRNRPQASPHFTFPRLPSPSPSLEPVANGLVTFQLLDGITQQPLSGQSIAVMVSSPDCTGLTSCPSSSPLVIGADNTGRIQIDKVLAQQGPKFYAAGYVADSYFSFDAAAQQIVVYKPLPGMKIGYDPTKEEIPLGLTPAH
jgi:hypothetical protein